MPNLVITNECNLKCPFCFAAEYRVGVNCAAAKRMDLPEFQQLVDFAKVGTVRFCGGEPTLHPQFAQMLALALAERKRTVLVMTNGLWPAEIKQHYEKLPGRDKKRITFLLNLLHEPRYEAGQWTQICDTLSRIEPRQITLGFTLFSRAFEFDSFLAVAEKYSIRQIRFSVAAPTVTEPKSWLLNPETDFRALAGVIHSLVLRARSLNIKVVSDCAYVPPCFFTAEQLAELFPRGPSGAGGLSFRCEGPIDVGPGGEAWRCFGLFSSLRGKVADFSDGASLAGYFEEATARLAARRLFEHCDECALRNIYDCGGGCHAFRAVRQMTHQAGCADLSLVDDSSFFESKPVQNLEATRIYRENEKLFVMLKSSDGSWERLFLEPYEEILLEQINGKKKVREMLASFDEETKNRTKRTLLSWMEKGVVTFVESSGR